jgi:hypothetical protein
MDGKALLFEYDALGREDSGGGGVPDGAWLVWRVSGGGVRSVYSGTLFMDG